MQEKEQKKEETQKPKGGKDQRAPDWEETGQRASSSSSGISPTWHRNSLLGSGTWLPSLLYPQHLEQSLVQQSCQTDIW